MIIILKIIPAIAIALILHLLLHELGHKAGWVFTGWHFLYQQLLHLVFYKEKKQYHLNLSGVQETSARGIIRKR